MGMSSYFTNEDFEIKDWEGLSTFMKKWREMFPESWIGSKDCLMINEKDKTFTFDNWTDLKLVSYWYDEQLVFLKCVAKYLEGQVEWDFESKDEAGWVEFRNKECIIHTGQMTWQDWKPEQSFRFKVENWHGMSVKNEKDRIAKWKKLVTLAKL